MKKIIYLCFIAIMAISFSALGQSDWKRTIKENGGNFFKIKKRAEKYFSKEKEEKEESAKKSRLGKDEGEKETSSTKATAVKEEEKGEWEDNDYMKYKRWEWYWRDRVNKDGSFPDLSQQYQQYLMNQKSSHKLGAADNSNWKNISQTTSIGGYNGMGRATSVAFHPTDINTYYVGAPIGGIWKTTDGGNSYTPLGDALPYVSVGCIVIDHKNPNTLYISTGDMVGWWNNSMGIYKSTDAGQTWAPTSLSWQLSAGVAVMSMAISPVDPSIVWVAASNGLYKTVNSGSTWTKVRTGFYSDVRYRPGDANVVYTALHDYWGVSQVFRSDNNGGAWTQLSNFTATANFIKLSVTPANPDMLGVLCSANKEFYSSMNKGTGLTLKSKAPESDIVFISPNNANIIYTGGVDVHKSTDAGATWTQATKWHGGTQYPEVHADNHFVTFNPLAPGFLYFCNDGGVYKHTEATNSWQDRSNGLVITQFYRIANSQINANIMIGGSQDNGGRKRNNNGSWTATNGGDAMEVAIDPTDDKILYTTYINGELYRSLDGWVNDTYKNIGTNIPGGKPTGDWVTPYVLDPSDSKVIVAGYNDVYRSVNRGDTWTKLSNLITGDAGKGLTSIAVAPSNSNVIYASVDNKFYRTTNLGANWTTITAPTTEKITSITVHPTDQNTVWITRGGYSAGQKVFKSTDGGNTWINISGILPNVAFNTLVYQKGSQDGIYAGSDMGIYYRNSSMSDWITYSNNIPFTSVTDLEIQYSSAKLRAATYGRGIWESDLYNSVSLRTPENPVLTTSGLDYKYFEGNWNSLPDFKLLTPVKTGISTTIDLSNASKTDLFGFEFTGYIDVPTDGQYTFYTSSDDGSQLYIGTTLVVDNDGLHGSIEKSGTIGLKKGKHAIKIVFFEQAGEEGLTVNYEGPGITKKIITSNVLYRLTPPVNCTGTGEITRQIWQGVTGTTIAQIPFNNPPTVTTSLLLFEDPVDVSDNFGERIKGYLCPPYTGKYTFWISGDDDCELWLSTNDKQANKTKIAFVTDGWTPSQIWDKYPSQKSIEITLTAGQKYYVEALHKEGGGGDNLAVAWTLPNGTFEAPIQGSRLFKFINQLPAASITLPVNNKLFLTGENATINVNASDVEGAIYKVEFYNGNTKLGEDLTSPYSFTWNNLKSGTYSLTAKATDLDGGTTTTAVVNIKVNTPPTISISSPLTGSVITAPANIVLKANCTDADGTITLVEFYHGNIKIGEVLGSPFNFSWNNVPFGTYSITAKATDNDGSISTSSVVSIKVNSAPILKILAPTDSAIFYLPVDVTIDAQASDKDGKITKVEFYNGADKLGESLTQPYSFKWTNISAGTYQITVVSIDDNDEKTSTTVTIIVKDQVTSISNSTAGALLDVYPNPASDRLVIELFGKAAIGATNILIQDAKGRTVLSLNTTNQSLLKLDVNEWASGVYLIHVSNKNLKTVRKVMIDR